MGFGPKKGPPGLGEGDSNATVVTKSAKKHGKVSGRSPKKASYSDSADASRLVPLEKHVERNCDKLMAALGWTSIHFSQSRASMQTPGIPDRKYYRGDRTFWLEVKRPGGKQSVHQVLFQSMCHEAEELYCCGGEEELKAFLTLHGLAPRKIVW